MTKLHSESISDMYIFISNTIPLDESAYSVSAARGPIGLHSVAEHYPQLADQLLPNLAESYPALCGKIDAPIRQDSVSAARGPIGLHSVAEHYPQLADQLLPNLAESYPALCGKIDAPIRQDSVSAHQVVNKLKNIIKDIDHKILIFKYEMYMCLIITTTIRISAFTLF